MIIFNQNFLLLYWNLPLQWIKVRMEILCGCTIYTMRCYDYLYSLLTYFLLQCTLILWKITQSKHPTIRFILLITFPMLLCVSPTNRFIRYLLQISFSIACALCFINLLHPFSAYVLRSGSANYMGFCHGLCNYLFLSSIQDSSFCYPGYFGV